MTAPFGGIQSELPLTEIEALGFADVQDFLFHLGRARSRAGYTTLPAFSVAEPIVGIADFYNVNGVHIQVVMTPTKLYQFLSGAWTQITGTAFGGATSQLFSWDVLNYNLCFSQGSDKIWMWDGVSTSYVQASANAPRARYIAEIGLHLFAVDPAYPQRYYWSGIGDPTDWTSFTSGLNDVVGNLGPINGILKLGQYGFGFHQNGIMQIIPTGVGLAPFAFQPVINATQGVIAPYSLQHFDDRGMELAVYLGVDNVYVFNGSSIEPFGDRPLDGQRRVGARSRILADVLTGGVQNVVGAITYSVSGNVFKAYWLGIPNVAVWVYNFDEGNWTRFTYSKKLRTLGPFLNQGPIRIMDLVGSIAGQSWTPITLQTNNPFLGFLLGFDDGTAGYVDFTNYSENGASITSGKLTFGDRRHKHTIKKFRVSLVDKGPVTVTITITNEAGFSQTKSFTIGTGSGDVLSYVQEFNITGLRLQWELSVPANAPAEILEFAPIYDTSGEQRCGTADGN